MEQFSIQNICASLVFILLIRLSYRWGPTIESKYLDLISNKPALLLIVNYMMSILSFY